MISQSCKAMTKVGRGYFGVLCLLVLATMVAPVVAQQFPGLPAGQTADQNVVPTEDRRPGAMVAAGLFRAQNTLRDPLAPVNITATEPTLTPLQEFGVEAADTVAAGIADFLVFLAERLLGRAGVELDTTSEFLVGLLGGSGLGISDLLNLTGTTARRRAQDASLPPATAEKLSPNRSGPR